MTRRPATVGAVIAALAVSWAVPAGAHPHVWIDAHIGFAMDGTHIRGLDLTWRFDELFSDYVRTTYDRDQNGQFDAEESRALEGEAFAAVKEFGYFTHMRVAGALRAFGEHSGFSAAIDDGIVVYRFTLPVETGPDAASEPVTVALYDESYYVDVALQEIDPVALDAATGCSFAVAEDTAHPIYYGMIMPIAVSVRCATS